MNSSRGAAIVMGVIAAIAAGALFNFALPGGVGIVLGAVVGMSVLFMLLMTSSNRKIAPAGEAERQQAQSMRPPPGKGLLIVFRNGFVAKAVGLNLAVDGVVFAQVLSPQFAAVVVTPGKHILAVAAGGVAQSQVGDAQWAFEASPGSVHVIFCRTKFGAIRGSTELTEVIDRDYAKGQLQKLRMAAADVAEI